VNRLAPLSELLSVERDPGSNAAFLRGEPVSWGRFCASVSGLRGALAPHPRGRWVLACDSTYSFAVGLAALWQSGDTAVLPANLASGSIEEAAVGTSGMIADSFLGVPGIPVLRPQDSLDGERGFRAIGRGELCLELYTSGSSGGRRKVAKTAAQLEDEIAALEEAFGTRLGDCAVLGTVSHQHIYGLLFRLLWPLCAGRPFVSESLLHWSGIFDAMRRSSPCCLAASPTHLSRFPRGAALEGIVCRGVFSSGGRLDPGTAARVGDALGVPATDVLGSTETGGVGWREPAGGAELWKPFPRVRLLELEGGPGGSRLGVVSPAADPAGKVVLLGDRGEVREDGSFRLGARSDRVVKVAEKRLSLDELELFLEECALVSRAAAVRLLDARSGLGAAVVPSAEGRGLLDARGGAGLRAALRKHLSSRFDPSTLPRRFCFLDSLPVDDRGKLPVRTLELLFAPKDAEELESRREGDSLVKRMRVPEDLLYLDGHFPGQPVVPGAAQLRWAARAGEELLGPGPGLSALASVKFKAKLLPGSEFTLRVRPSGRAPRELRFSLESLPDGRTISTGRCSV